MEPYPDPADLDHCSALLFNHLRQRAAVAEAIATQAEAAWQEWIDQPAYLRADQADACLWLAARAEAARKIALDAATLRPTWCSVEPDPAGGVRLLVGIA